MDEDKNKDDIQQQVTGGQADNRPQDKPDAAAEGQDAAREGADAPEEEQAADGHSDYKPVDRFDASAVHHLSRMYKNWFLDYASTP